MNRIERRKQIRITSTPSNCSSEQQLPVIHHDISKIVFSLGIFSIAVVMYALWVTLIKH